jgi:DNA-binding transcriptional regulator YdaS (Cro superfamily)
MAAIQDIQNLIAQAKPIPADLQKAALLEAQQQGLDNQALADVFGVPVSMISDAYEATGVTPAAAVEPTAIERLTQNQAAPESLSPAATTTISSPFLPDAIYEIPDFVLPDYRYNDTSSSGGGLSSTSGGLTNYVTAVEPARSGPEGYTGPSINRMSLLWATLHSTVVLVAVGLLLTAILLPLFKTL